MERPRGSSAGMTLVEMVVVTAITGILFVVLAGFLGANFRTARQHYEQFRITENARLAMARISREIRNGQYVTCGDGSTYTNWIKTATAYEVTFISDVNGDGNPEQVRYYLDDANDGTVIQREITAQDGSEPCTFTGTPEDVGIAAGIRNATTDPATSLFTYFASDGSQTSDLARIAKVRISLVVDENETQWPDAAILDTDVILRNSPCTDQTCGVAACYNPGGLVVPETLVAYTGDFAKTAFDDCRDHCATNTALDPGECCGWSVGLNYDACPGTDALGACTDPEVWGYCSCTVAEIPEGLTPQSVNVTGLTDFYKACWDGTTCTDAQGLHEGIPYCAPACAYDDPGTVSCACECPTSYEP